jgi:hypothetical protein
MERALGSDLSRVRLHDDRPAHDMAHGAPAHAFAVGHEIGFAPGRNRPGTIVGDAILAHELAHTIQFQGGRRADREGAAMERDANHAALGALSSLYGHDFGKLGRATSPSGSGGLRLLRCGDSAPDVAPQDWREADRAESDDIARQIRDKHEAIAAIMRQPHISDGDFARMNQLYNEIDALVARLRAMGHQAPSADLLQGILSGAPADRSIHILAMHGATPAPVQWGERRQFDLDLDWVPPNTEIYAEWYVEGNDGEWAMDTGLPPRVTPSSPTGAITLGENMWTGPVGARLLTGEIARFRVIAKLRVGRTGTYESTLTSPWMPVSNTPPQALTIQSNGLEYPAAVPVGLAAAGGTSSNPPAPVVPTGPPPDPVGLAGAALEFSLSWVAPPPFQGQPGYRTEWQVDPPPPAAPEPPVYLDPFARANARPTATGRYVMHARVRRAEELSLGRTRLSRDPVLEASLAFQIVSSSDLAERGLAGLQAQGGPADYASTVRDLDAQIAAVDQTRSRGSPAMWRLDAQRVALGQMRERMTGHLGQAPLPLPATGPLDRSGSFVAPLPAVMAVPEARSAVPLRTFVRLDFVSGSWRCWLVDATTQDVVRFEGTGSSEEAAVRAALNDWHARNELPQNGTVRWDITVLGTRVSGSYSTSAGRKTFWEWFDRIVFGLQALLAVILLVTPDPTLLTKGAAIALLTVGVLRGVYRLYQSLSLGRPVLDERHVLEALGILLSIVGMSGGRLMASAGRTALAGEQLSAGAVTQFAVGRGMVMTAVAGDVGTFVWVAHSGMAQMRAIAADTSLPEAERTRQIEQLMLGLAAQGLLLIGTNATLFRGGGLTPRGTRAPAFVDAMGDLRLDPVMRSRIEVTLRRYGATEDLSTLEPRALLERYMTLQQARGEVADEISARGATRGLGVYEAAAEGTQSAATVERAARPLARAFATEGMRLANVRTSGTLVTADLVVEVPASGSSPAQTLTVPVQVTVTPKLGAGGAHGEESGMARVALAGDHTSGFRLNIELDSRLSTESDVRHNLSHELREGADMVRRLSADPTTDLAAQQGAGVFAPGASTDVTSHARAAAFELSDVFAEARTVIGNYDRARSTASGSRGTGIPDAVRLAGEAAYRRLDAMLDAMGFADPATRASKRAALLSALGTSEGTPLTAFVDGYGQRAEARVRRQQALNDLDPSARTGLGAGLGPDLEAHLAQRTPAEAVAPLAELMSRNDPGNVVRGFVREVVRQHRAGRLTDATLGEVVNRLNQLLRSYGSQLLDPSVRGEITRTLQTEAGPGALGALGRLEARVVARGVPLGAMMMRPEAPLTGNGVHGIAWTEAAARQRAVVEAADFARTSPGVAPTRPFDQGKFGSLADVNYAVQCAAQFLGEPGNAAGRPRVGVFQLPAGHRNVVYRPGTSTPIVPDVVFVQVNPGGEVHAYPADSTVLNLGAVGGAAGIRPVVSW